MKKKYICFFTLLVISLMISALFIVSSLNKNKRYIDNRKDIMILFTSDVHCGINENFGYSGLYETREQLKK